MACCLIGYQLTGLFVSSAGNPCPVLITPPGENHE
jgi:hypothetical protein